MILGCTGVRSASKWKQPYSKTCGYVSEDHGYLHTQSVCRYRNGKTGRDWRCSGKNPPHHITTSTPPNPPTSPKHRVQTTGEKPKRLKEQQRHRDHPNAGIQATGNPHPLTRQHQGVTGYICSPLKLMEQTHTRIKIKYCFKMK